MRHRDQFDSAELRRTPRRRTPLAWLFVVSALGGVPATAQEPLDDGWTVTAGGQAVTVGADGIFRIPNVSSPDRDGDGLSDDFVRVTGTKQEAGRTLYLFTEPFRVPQGGTVTVGEVTITETAPPLPEAIRFPAAAYSVPVGGRAQLRVFASLEDSREVDVTRATDWTAYRTSNTAIAEVDRGGLVTGVGPGTAFVTATNDGATAVVRVEVLRGGFSTTVRGFVQLEDGTRVGGAEVSSSTAFGGSALSAADGSFSFAIQLSQPVLLRAVASRAVGEIVESGVSSAVSAEPDGFSDVGIVVLHPPLDGPLFRDDVNGRIDVFPFGLRSLVGGDFDGDGDTDLAAIRRGLGISPVLAMLANDGSANFELTPHFAGLDFVSLAMGDLDADGDLDLAAADGGERFPGEPGAQPSVFLFLNDGTGGAFTTRTLPVARRPTHVVVADFDGDGMLDIATSHCPTVVEGSVITVLLNQGLPGESVFAEPLMLDVGPDITSLAAADLDGDLLPELLAAHDDEVLTVLTSAGLSGVFPTIPHARFIASGDLDADGDQDVLLLAGSGSFCDSFTSFDVEGTVAVMMNRGKGELMAPLTLASARAPRFAKVLDLNEDDHPEVLFSDASSLKVLLGSGDGTFTQGLAYPTARLADSMVIEDLNSDGAVDIAASSGGTLALSLLLNEGGGTFPNHELYPSRTRPAAVDLGDFDGDGQVDVASAVESPDFFGPGAVELRFNRGDGSLAEEKQLVVGGRPTALLLEDLDGDNDLDVITANEVFVDFAEPVQGSLSVLINEGDRSFAEQQSTATFVGLPTEWFNTLAIADVDRDGDGDAAIGQWGDLFGVGTVGAVLLFRGVGDGRFEAPVALPCDPTPMFCALGDLDGDEWPELVSVTLGDPLDPFDGFPAIYVYRNDGTGSFSAGEAMPSTVAFGSNYSAAIELHDLDTDGDLDLAVAEDELFVFDGRGDATFSPKASLGARKGARLRAADVDGNGFVDLVLAGGDGVSLFLREPTGFLEPIDFGVGGHTVSVAIADIDRDGDQDLVAAWEGGISVLRNQTLR